MRPVLCARQSRSMAAQLVAFDWRYFAVSAGCTAPLVFLPTSALDPARHRLASRPGVCAYAARAWQADRRRARAQSRTFGCRGRRAGFGRDGREWRYVLGLLDADGADESSAVRQLGFATGDARRIVGCHLGAAYDAERGQHNQNRSTAPAANKRRVRSNDRKPVDPRRSMQCLSNRGWRRRLESDDHKSCVRLTGHARKLT
jgi:hypothetical protein